MRRSSIVAGIILILAGLFFLALPLFPNLAGVINIGQQWPLIIVGEGFLFLLGALLGTPGLAVPGSIIAGTGLILYYQNLTGEWWTWSFAWALYPGFVGIGIIISNLLEGKGKEGLRDGGRLIIISAIMFGVFGFFLGGSLTSGVMLALALIGAGIWILYRTLGQK